MTRSQPSAEKIKALFADAVAKLHRGDAVSAARGFEKLVRAIPDSAVAWYNLGLARQHGGRPAGAEKAYQKALNLDPGNVDAMVNLGLAQKALGDSQQAMRCAESALGRAPQHPRALNLAGTLRAENHDHAAAIDNFRAALGAAPGDADARHNLANSLLQTGATEDALHTAEPLLEAASADPNAAKRHRLLVGEILLQLKRFGETAKMVRELADFAEDEEVLLLDMSLGEMSKDYFAVIDIARKLLDKDPKHARVWNSLGSAYFQLDSIAHAADCYDRAIALAADCAEYHNNRGLAHAATGEKAAAERCYRAALKINPQYAEAHRNLVAMKKFTSMDDADAAVIEEMWQAGIDDDFQRAKMAFALGKVYDDVGDYDRAYATYAIGNRLKFAESTLDFDRYFAHIDAVPEVFTAPPQRFSETAAEPCPIFVLGMPRSGTTLVEQILSRHGAVSGCGELPCIEKAIARLEKRATPMRVYPRDFLRIDSAALAKESRHYLSWVARLHDLKTPFFTDKMPFNFVHLWLIKAMFPAAAIVHCHRHPLDVIVSNYFQMYASDVSFVYDLEVLAQYYVRYWRLMRHWRQVFGDEIHTIQYEVLVGDLERETRRLIAAVKLPWDEACMDMKKSATAVRTASIWQVRQGIYTTSRERWRHYVEQLAPAINILQAAEVLGDEMQELGVHESART